MNNEKKKGLFTDHPIEDVLEKIAVQFTARHIRGRPRPPFWYPGWPLYVCHSRYNERERVFVKIKNWASCIPEEVRKKDEFMPIDAFERMVYPGKVKSPFVGGPNGVMVKGPGGIGEPLDKAEGTRRHPGGETAKTVVTPQMTAAVPAQVPKAYAPPVVGGASGDTKDRSMLTAAGTLSVPPIVDKLPPETSCVSVSFFY